LYRTFAAYKAHVYRHHQSDLQAISQKSTDGHIEMNLQQEQNTDEVTGSISIDTCSDDGSEVSDNSSLDMKGFDNGQAFDIVEEDSEMTMSTLVKSFLLFIVQLREVFHLRKNTMNTITSYLQICHNLFNYDQPVAIINTDQNSNAESEIGYFIPIERSLRQMLDNERFLSLVLNNINKERRSNMLDDNLMFSFRHGQFGSRVDDDSLLIQLYLDDIGVTNPIGAKKDNHKLSMLYFSLEDIPDRYRSKLDFIQLLAVCPSKVLKVSSLITS
jgi:hypothetical protein